MTQKTLVSREEGHNGDDKKPGRPTGASEIMQRRLEYAWEEIKHLAEELNLVRESASGQQEKKDEELLSLKAELHTLRQSLDEKEQHLGVTTSESTSLTHEIDLLHQDLHDKEQRLGKTTAERNRLADQLEMLQHRLSDKDQLLEKTVALYQQTSRQLVDRNAAFDDLRLKLDTSQEELSTAHNLVTNLQKVRPNRSVRANVPQLVNQEAVMDQRSRRGGFSGSSRLGEIFGNRLFRGLVVGVTLTTAVAGILWPRPDEPQLVASKIISELIFGQSTLNADEAPIAKEPVAQDQVRVSTAAPILQVRDVLKGGSMGPRMIVIEPGTFAMGNRASRALGDEWPVHEVKIHKFLLGAHEVTFDEYDRFARATGRRLPDDSGYGRGRRPVVDVSWSDAQAYANWLYHQTGRRYRLPSEAEWEYAARSGSDTAYWWGYEPGQGRAVCFDCGTQWDNRVTPPVGSFRANAFGLYDTAGNAMEWVADCYHPDYKGAPDDGRVWADGDCSTRVARGGAFNKPSTSMRSMARHHYAPDTRIKNLGFRLASDS